MNETLSQKIKRRQAELQLTTPELSKKSNLSPNYLSEIIRERVDKRNGKKVNPRNEKRRKLALALELQENELDREIVL